LGLAAGAGQDNTGGFEKDFKIEPQRPLVDVSQVQLHPVVKADVVAAGGDLPQAAGITDFSLRRKSVSESLAFLACLLLTAFFSLFSLCQLTCLFQSFKRADHGAAQAFDSL